MHLNKYTWRRTLCLIKLLKSNGDILLTQPVPGSHADVVSSGAVSWISEAVSTGGHKSRAADAKSRLVAAKCTAVLSECQWLQPRGKSGFAAAEIEAVSVLFLQPLTTPRGNTLTLVCGRKVAAQCQSVSNLLLDLFLS